MADGDRYPLTPRLHDHACFNRNDDRRCSLRRVRTDRRVERSLGRKWGCFQVNEAAVVLMHEM